MSVALYSCIDMLHRPLVLFHGYDETYHRADILKHLGMSITDKLFDDEGNERTPESFFSKCIPENFIHSRKMLLGSLQDGLTIGGCSSNATTTALQDGCGMARDIFYAVPMQAIKKIYFSKMSITVEDLLAVIVPKYGDEGEYRCSMNSCVDLIIF